ncbi:MAG: flagellar protein FlbB [Spirochaetia bacterium]|nr:flagellar protein FlbB [Spirochaetia bacterium]MDD5776696.1 flagellar protein FlbB [Treponema sp.]MCI6827213.1 flagellar protein FlbB [Spirochaetia bacterium]MCI7109896.1 flagellar protein FlbB [Spirochaetia bacterium]MCI7564347.1 flagellar protein FlbB [Spirochaetia bacterium]
MKSVGKTIVLIMLILILIFGSLLWFQYLGLMPVKSFMNPVFKLFHLEPQTSVTQTSSSPVTGDLYEDRLNAQRESLSILEEELNLRNEQISKKEKELEQLAGIISEKEKSLEEREKTFNQIAKQYDDKEVNIEQIAIYLNSMPPNDAVALLENMDDQQIIDILRKVDKMAADSGAVSMSSVWLMNMKSERAAEISRKMINKPEALE